jgi:Protein of unknown function (DUF1353)
MNVPQFEGQVDTQWRRHEDEDRDMQLLSDFAFIDSRGIRWDAPAGRIINGASIPEVLWSKIVGTPYVGDYRRATVVHDVACQDKAKPHEEVHRMFYDAMLCDGVSEERAFLMYTAVRLFGPKWPSRAAQQRSRRALRRFDIGGLTKALDQALGEHTRWRPNARLERTGRRTARHGRAGRGAGRSTAGR